MALVILSFVILFCGILYFAARFYKAHKIKQQMFVGQTLQQRIAQEILQDLYRDVNGAILSRAERERLHIDAYSLTYGEIDFYAFQQILAVVAPQKNQIFYDLGSGTGKAVFAAALLYDFAKVCGIELLPALQQQSQYLYDELLKYPKAVQYFSDKQFNIHFVNDDIFVYDFSDADIVFINATGFFGNEWNALLTKLEMLKKGARIILTSKKLSAASYELLYDDIYHMSWGMCSVYIYKKI